MRKVLTLLLLICVPSLAGGCVSTSVSYLKYERCSPRKAASAVAVYYSRKAIPRDYKVVAKYRVHTNSRRYADVLERVKKLAAKHGSDAIVVDAGFGHSVTLWTWLLFLIPMTEHTKLLHVSGVRYLPAVGGQP